MIVIDAGFFCVAVVFSHRNVSRTAPIVSYMIGWNATRVRQYARHRGWKITYDEVIAP